MEIRHQIKENERAHYLKMSPGMRLRLAIELSDFVQKLQNEIAPYGKRIQRSRTHTKRGKKA